MSSWEAFLQAENPIAALRAAQAAGGLDSLGRQLETTVIDPGRGTTLVDGVVQGAKPCYGQPRMVPLVVDLLDTVAATRDYAFFTLAPLYLASDALTKIDFFENYCQEINRDVTVRFTRFPRPIVCGCTTPDGDRQWEHGLFALERPLWPSFASYLRTIVFGSLTAGGAPVGIFGQQICLARPVFSFASFGLFSGDRYTGFVSGLGSAPWLERNTTRDRLWGFWEYDPYWMLKGDTLDADADASSALPPRGF